MRELQRRRNLSRARVDIFGFLGKVAVVEAKEIVGVGVLITMSCGCGRRRRRRGEMEESAIAVRVSDCCEE